MKKILLTTICLAFATFSFSQQLSRYVVSSGGNYSTNGGYSNSSTIGESMVTTLTSTSNVLTQGFQQSFSNPVDPTIVIINPLNGDVFPNNNNIGIDFAITDFVVAAGTGDGHIHYYVNGAMTMKYDTLPITLNGLANGSHQIIIELVDNSHQGFSPTIADTVNFSVNVISGCTDSTALNYDPTATVDDGSCVYCVYGCTDSTAVNYAALATCDDGTCTYAPISCTPLPPTNAYISELIHDRARVNWDNMNDANCMVQQYRIRYRELGTSTWLSKTMSGSGLCVFGLNTTSKKILGLTASTTYEYYMKAWYCGGGISAWSAIQNFTTLDLCPNVINFVVSSPTTTKASFTWDTTAAYSFARIKLRPDTTGGVWTTAGGFGVFYPALTKDKNGLTPGQTYRASARTWCDPTGGTYRSTGWTSPIFWTQPNAIRVEGGSAINNLTVYPNPSRDVFNVSFTSEDAQDLEVRIINVVGEVIISEDLQQFIGEYTKQVNLVTYTKGVYFLEIEMDDGIINKKLILQ
jgi:hypothetical protein